jgi:hypothetical protein
MPEPVQSYRKHTRFLPAFHFFVIPVLLINLLNSIRHVWRDPSLHFGWEMLVAAALLGTAFLARIQALTVQDRVIRLEMRLRLRGILPAELQPNIDQLTRRQLVALRFASDAEMAELVRGVLAGKLTTAKDIKMTIKNWQGDWLRA